MDAARALLLERGVDGVVARQLHGRVVRLDGEARDERVRGPRERHVGGDVDPLLRRRGDRAVGGAQAALAAEEHPALEVARPRRPAERLAEHRLAVVDHDLGDEVRFIATLSGGERFLVSLALALGLSTLSSKSVRIESLFIDEGFGSLDRGTLEVALATLDQLQAEGRTVGIISHIAELSERIGYRVEVRPTGPGTSEVRVKGV